MISHLFCTRCGKRQRSERHSCDPSAIKAKTRFDTQWNSHDDEEGSE